MVSWDWGKLCGRRGANFTIWDNGDFGHCFEQLAIICPSHMILAVISIYHFARHGSRSVAGRIPHSPTLYVRFGVSLGLVLLPLLLLALIFLYEKLHPSLIDIISWAIRAVTWLLHSGYVWRLRRYYHIHIRGPVSVILAFFLTTASMIIQLRTVIRHMINSSSYFDVVEQYVTFITLVHHFLYALSLIPWRRAGLGRYVSAYQAINESTEQEVADRFRGYGSISTPREELGRAEHGAGFFSKLTFWWVNPLMLRGYNGKVTSTADLFQLPPKLNTQSIDILFTSNLKSKSYNTRDHPGHSSVSDDIQVEFQSKSIPTLWRALNRTFGWQYYSLGILKFVGDGLGFAGPLLLNLLVKYMENPDEVIWHGYIYALGLFLTTLLSSIFATQFNYHISVVGLRIRAALITTVYRKSLKVSSAAMSKSSTGEIVNFMSTDTDRIVNFCPSFHAFWSLPVQMAVSLYLLYTQVSWAFLAGLGFTIILIPINRWLAIKIGQLSTDMMNCKDERVKVMNEILYGIRVIKMYSWESHFMQRIGVLRDAELKSLKGRKYLDAMCVYFWATTPVLISILTFTTYAMMGNQLTAAKVFTSMALFVMLIMPLNAFPWVINGLMEAWVSVKRLHKFLNLDELDWEKFYTQTQGERECVLDISSGSFSWDEIDDKGECHSKDTGNNQSSTQNTSLVINDSDADHVTSNGDHVTSNGDHVTSVEDDMTGVLKLHGINLHVKQGMFVGVIGRVGAGKSTLLSAIQGELYRTGGTVYLSDQDTGFGLAGQEPWLQHATVRDNILFGHSYLIDRYESVIAACALTEDLKILPAGDLTEVGENGITLSGGQKARISLARAVYQDKDIYLLDDPLAAVDAHVARHLYQQCIMGLLRDKTCILCTHHVDYLREAELILVMENGTVTKSGTPDQILSNLDADWLGESTNQDVPGGGDSDLDPDDTINGGDTLVEEEEKDTGVVKLHVYKAYWHAVGSCLALMVLLSLWFMQASRNITDWWLSYWVTHSHGSHHSNTSIYYTHIQHLPYSIRSTPHTIYSSLVYEHSPWHNVTDTAEDDVKFYLTIYGSLAVANSAFTFARAFLFAYGGICAATVVHNNLLESILRAPISFFDVTPIGRILNRFSSDLYAVDDSLPFMLNIFLAQIYGLCGTLIITAYGLPWFMLLLAPLAVLYYFIQKYYRQTSREIKRITSVTLSPIYAHFSETLTGLGTIRALRHVERFEAENRVRLEDNQRAQFAGQAASQWLGVRLQAIGVLMVTGVALIAVLEHHFHAVNAGLVGLALSYALSVTGLLNGVVTFFTETEKQMVSMERACQYTDNVPQETEWATLNAPPYWPIQGNVTFQHVSLQYRSGQPLALKNICFDTEPAEKIGIVGRTGSGKSSLFLTLFRMVDIQSGQILIDGINVQHLPIKQLRSRLAIIPQDPFLFSGSVRDNLDPTKMYADHEILSVLEACHMLEAVRRLGGLMAEVGEKGRKFSVGQRQLMCLARALLTRAKVLCIDEATASVDQETDSLIQQTIHTEFHDQTVLTIAHRINTILDSDRVMVMSGGEIVEFASPARLLKNKQSMFYSLVHGNKEQGNGI